MIKGAFQTSKTNDWGFTSVKVSGTWYSSDKKNFNPQANEGDIVEFEAFEKAGKEGRTYPTYKAATFRKVANPAPTPAAGAGGSSNSGPSVGGRSSATGSSANRDTYWADKAATDAAKDPRISLQGAYKVAVEFLPVVIAQGALPSFDKAKATAKLEILRSFLDEEAQRIHAASYAAKVPAKSEEGGRKETVDEVGDEPEETDEKWS